MSIEEFMVLIAAQSLLNWGSANDVHEAKSRAFVWGITIRVPALVGSFQRQKIYYQRMKVDGLNS
jgi:hypothetical protein